MKKYLFVISFLVAVIFIAPNISLAAVNAGGASSYADLQAQIQTLLAQIAALQAQMSQQQPQQWCYDFRFNLNSQSSGKEVGQLQAALEKQGFEISSYEKTNQIFGELTSDAIVGFQQKYKDEILSPYNLKYGTGFVGKSTRAKLNSLYGCGIIQPIPTPAPVPTPIPVPIINQPPVVGGVSGPTTLNINQTGTWEVKASDPERGVLNYQVFWGDEAVGVSTQLSRPLTYYSQTAAFTHSYSMVGIYYPTFTVTDDKGFSAKTSISVKVGETSITQPVLSISPTNITVGNTYTFSGSVKATPNSDVKLYFQMPNGTMKYENYYFGKTDANGVLKITTTRTIPNVYCCTYSAWVEIGGQKSNPVNINITPAVQPSITVLSPNGGEQWEVGKTYEIKWTNNTGQNARISLMKGNSYIGQNWDVSASLSSYNIIIPSSLTLGSDYKIRIGSVNSSNVIDGKYTDDSSYFSIVAATAAVSPMVCVDINNATYSGSISTGGGIWPGYNWGYGYGTYYTSGWLDNNKSNTGNYPLEIHYIGNSTYGINYGIGELKFTCDGAAKTVWLPAVSYPLGGSAPVLYVASDGSTYYDKARTQLARSAGIASVSSQHQMASVLQSAEKVLMEMFNYLNR